MTIRPVDDSGDMMPVYSSDQMLTGAEATVRSIDDMLHLFRGEWWEDEELGTLIAEYFAQTIKQGDIPLFANYLTSYISRMDGVAGVTNVVTGYADHRMTYRCTVITSDGSEDLEVDVDGLL